MEPIEEMMLALGEAIGERGYIVEGLRDSPDLPYILDISKEGVTAKRPDGRVKSVILAEDQDNPGWVEVCTEHEDDWNYGEIDLADPTSIDKIFQILELYLSD